MKFKIYVPGYNYAVLIYNSLLDKVFIVVGHRNYMPNMENAKEGEKIEIVLIGNKTKVSGVVYPSNDKKVIVLKMDSGYNVGFDVKKIKSIRKLGWNRKKKEEDKKDIKIKKGLPTIAILQVGGTIVSKIDYSSGGVITKLSPGELIDMMPEIREIANVSYRKILDIMSEDIRFGHYNLIAKEVEKEIKKGVKGVIITHGTDTMHMTAAALSFIMHNVPIPVLLVGAQRSGDRGSSDGIINMICAAHFIAKSGLRGVGICMHKGMDDDRCVIIPGVKARKMHTSRRDAFRVINGKNAAEVTKEGKIEVAGGWHKSEGSMDARYLKENLKVGILKAHTNMFPENISCFKGYKGLVLEGTGLGHFPGRSYDKISQGNTKIRNELKKLIKNGCVVVLTSQCIFGRVNMNVYTPGRELMEMGIIPGEDMTTETAFIKLAWLLSNFKAKEAGEMMGKNLRGEISSRTEVERDFL